MHERRFSRWIRWGERDDLANCDCPGVYVIAKSSRRLSGNRFHWIAPIIYVGMTNGASGLEGRLTQFDNTISRKRRAHGGADRVLFKHQKYDRLVSSLYVAVAPFKRATTSNLARDLRKMGDVARFEFSCLAEYAERYDRVPPFNDRKRSPKFSKGKAASRSAAKR